MQYAEALDYIHGLQRFGSRLGLERISRLLEAAGHPEEELRVIHVAGTNGKGSVTAMVTAILRAAGYSVGMYVSPFLEEFRERIQMDGECISEADLAHWAELLRPLAERMGQECGEYPTEFEFVTLVALCYYAARRVDLAVLEVGLGGRYDATNVVSDPVACVISNIALDHTDRLGKTLGEIAFEKAGIVKAGRPVVTGAREEEALRVIAQACEERDAPLYVAGRDFSWQERHCDYRGQSIDLHGLRGYYPDLRLSLLGRHQQSNAACAVAALEAGGLQGIDEMAIRRGLETCRWPGRLEVLGQHPLVVIDAAHNPDGVAALTRALPLFPYRRLVAVLGILKDKDAESMVAALAPRADVLIATAPTGSRAGRPERIAGLARPYTGKVWAEADITSALKMALAEAGPEDMVLVAGSIYLVGPARTWLRQHLLTEVAAPCRPA